MKLLIVDDDENIRGLLKLQLKHYFCTCIMASGLNEARKRINEEQLDAALLDIFLRDGDGLEVLRYLREHSHYKHLPVIIMTGQPKREVVNQAIQLGVSGFLSKPFLKDTLLQRLQQVGTLRKKPENQILAEMQAQEERSEQPLDLPRKIVLLEPNDQRRQTILDLLKNTAWTVIECEKLHDVDALMERSGADFLFVNITLKEGDLDAAELVNRMHNLPHQPGVVALSHSTETDDLLRAQENGITDFILDPVTQRKLEKTAQILLLGQKDKKSS